MDVAVRPLHDHERAAAGGVAGRALADSPTSRWVYGEPVVPRLQANLDLFVGLVSGQPGPVGALLGDHVVGVCAASPPGECFAIAAPPELRTPPETIGEPGDFSRAVHVWSLFCAHDLDERHWHLGPVSVEPGLQGAGVGSLMLRAVCDQMDAAGEVAWLETDKPENVVFYRRCGFDTTLEIDEHGFTTWWMRRDPR